MKKVFISVMALMFALSASAQDVQSSYNAAIEAYKAKNFAVAAKSFEEVIDNGMDDDAAQGMVTDAKTNLPTCYYMLGGRAMQAKDYDTAVARFSQCAQLAELYDNMQMNAKASSWLGKLYQTQGGTAFNNKDYATAADVFAKGYAADPRNTQMANWLGISLCEIGKFEDGMAIFDKVIAMGANPKYAEAAKQAGDNAAMYMNNQVAKLQASKDYDGVIALTDALLAKNPMNALAAKVRLQAYSDKGDYAKVFALAEETAALQASADEKSNVYFILGAAYNAKEMRPEAVKAFQKVTSGANAATAKATVAELSK